MRKIIRNPSRYFCPSGFIWIAYISNTNTNSNNNTIHKVIYPAGTFRGDIEDAINQTSANFKILNLIEVSIQG